MSEEESDPVEALVGDLRRDRKKHEKNLDPGKIPREITDKTYLVIDDDRAMRTLVKNALHNYEIHRILEAPGIDEARQILGHQNVDIILVDEEMPGMGGAEFTFMVRRGKMPVRADIPIIMITSHVEQNHVMLASNAGVDEFLAKPVSAARLYKRVYGCVFNKRKFVTDDDGYRGPERRWKKKEAEAEATAKKVEVLDFNNPKPEPKVKP